MNETADEARKAFGKWLRDERVAQGRSQADVARSLGTDQTVVSRAERGVRTSLETQLRIANELGVGMLPLPAQCSGGEQ